MTDKALETVAEALAALVEDRYPDSKVLPGSWVVSCEVIMLDDEQGRARWLTEGQGSLLTKRGLLELSRDQFINSIEESDE